MLKSSNFAAHSNYLMPTAHWSTFILTYNKSVSGLHCGTKYFCYSTVVPASKRNMLARLDVGCVVFVWKVLC